MESAELRELPITQSKTRRQIDPTWLVIVLRHSWISTIGIGSTIGVGVNVSGLEKN